MPRSMHFSSKVQQSSTDSLKVIRHPVQARPQTGVVGCRDLKATRLHLHMTPSCLTARGTYPSRAVTRLTAGAHFRDQIVIPSKVRS